MSDRNQQLPNDSFWATATDPEELVRYCVTHRNSFRDLQDGSGIATQGFRNRNLYLGIDEQGQSGHVWYDKTNELPRIFVNHLRQNTRIILQYTVGQPPTWDTQASSDEPDAIEATITGNQLLDFYWESYKADAIGRLVAEYAMIYLGGYFLCEWDETQGQVQEVLDPEKKLLRYEGSLHLAALTPWQVCFDPMAPTWPPPWVIWGELKPKWRLAEIYFNKREDIANATLNRFERFNAMEFGLVEPHVPHDYVWQWTFVHQPTPEVKEGRFLRWCENDIPLTSGPCPAYYKKHLPIHRLVHSDVPGTIITGHSPVSDGAPLQEALNAQMQIILQNHQKFGRWKFWSKYGEPLNLMDIAEGDWIQTDTECKVMSPPGSADLLATAQDYISQMGSVMGVAEASRGIAPSNETAALSLALQDSSTVTNNRGFDLNYRDMLQEVATSVIEILQVTADNSKEIAIIGENNKGDLKKFNKESLQPITRVLVVPASPMLRLNSGRVGFLEAIIAKFPQLISNESEILTALDTGNFRPVFKARSKQLALARSENQLIRQGMRITPEAHEDQLLHIRTHAEDMTNSDIISNPGLNLAFDTHIGLHIQNLTMGAALQVALGYLTPQQAQAFQMIAMAAAPQTPASPPAQGAMNGMTGAAPTPPPGVPQTSNVNATAQGIIAGAKDQMRQKVSTSPMQMATVT